MNTNNPILQDDLILSKIYLIRDQKVMLDSDLANMYGVSTRVLNQAVLRNMKRFPSDFMFQINTQEFTILKSQIVTSSWGGTRKLPYAFTEQGVATLSGVLNSDTAILINIQIMRVFVRVRQMLFDNTELRLAIEEIRKKTENNSKNIDIVFKYLDELIEKKENQAPPAKIGYKTP